MHTLQFEAPSGSRIWLRDHVLDLRSICIDVLDPEPEVLCEIRELTALAVLANRDIECFSMVLDLIAKHQGVSWETLQSVWFNLRRVKGDTNRAKNYRIGC